MTAPNPPASAPDAPIAAGRPRCPQMQSGERCIRGIDHDGGHHYRPDQPIAPDAPRTVPKEP